MSPPSCKVVLLGQENVGKTCLTTRILHNRFDEDWNDRTLGAAFGRKRMMTDDQMVILDIWDTAGAERFRAMTRQYYRNGFVAIICYDLTDSSSWEATKLWFHEIHKSEPDTRLYLCGTKLDLVKRQAFLRKIDIGMVRDFVEMTQGNANAVRIWETSSKSGEGVQEMFQQIALDYLESKKGCEDATGDIVLSEKSARKKCGC